MIVRTIGFGLGLSAYLMYALFVYAAQNFIGRSPVFAYSLGLSSLSELIGGLSSLDSFFITTFTLSCLGAGLFLASIIYHSFEEVLTRLLSRIRRSRPESENRLMEAQR